MNDTVLNQYKITVGDTLLGIALSLVYIGMLYSMLSVCN